MQANIWNVVTINYFSLVTTRMLNKSNDNCRQVYMAQHYILIRFDEISSVENFSKCLFYYRICSYSFLETILFWICKSKGHSTMYMRPKVTVYKRAETIQGRKYGIFIYNFFNFDQFRKTSRYIIQAVLRLHSSLTTRFSN